MSYRTSDALGESLAALDDIRRALGLADVVDEAPRELVYRVRAIVSGFAPVSVVTAWRDLALARGELLKAYKGWASAPEAREKAFAARDRLTALGVDWEGEVP